jgi:hypothetical protein
MCGSILNEERFEGAREYAGTQLEGARAWRENRDMEQRLGEAAGGHRGHCTVQENGKVPMRPSMRASALAESIIDPLELIGDPQKRGVVDKKRRNSGAQSQAQ